MGYQEELLNVDINGTTAAACEYKGIPFFIDSSSAPDGRKISIHDFPGRNNPIFEDTGRVPRLISIDGYFSDDNNSLSSIIQAQNAISKWNSIAGVGNLSHPVYGLLRARSGEMSRVDNKISGKVSFSITFYVEEVEKKLNPINFEQKINVKSDSVLDSIRSSFENVFSVINEPQYVLDSAITATREVLAVIEQTKSGVRRTAEYRDKFFQTIQNLNVIIYDSVDLANRLIELGGFGDEVISQTVKLNTSLLAANARSLPPITGEISTPQTTKINNNKAQLQELSDSVALVEIAKSTIDIDLTSTEEAQTAIQDIQSTFENFSLDSLNYELVDLINELLDLTIDNLEVISKELPSIKLVNIKGSTSVLNVTQDVYNDFEQYDDIVARNNIKHPMFIPSGTVLEVLV